MRAKFQIVNERIESFTGKRGKVEQRVISLLDIDADPMLNTVDYVLADDDKPKFTGRSIGRTVEIAIHNFTLTFGGRLRLQGPLLSVS